MRLHALAMGLAVLSTLLVAGPASAKELGFNVHQSSTVGLDATKDAGLKWVRIDLNWLDAEPNVQGTYDWTRFDTLIDAAVAKNLKVLAVIGYGPAWASQGDLKGEGSKNDVPKAGTFGPFVTAAVNRYKAKVTHWEIWNEPNLDHFFEGTPQEWVERVFVPGADAVHASCASCKVLGPGLATVGDKYATWMDVVFGQAKAKLDIVTGHIYHEFPTPNGGAGLTSDSFFNKLEAHRVIKVGNATVFEGPLSFKEMMDKHAITKPFWLTETGKEATLGNAAEEEAQRLYTRRVLEEMLQRPWWDATIFYESFDEPPAPYHWGAVVHDESVAKKYKPKSVHGFLAKVAGAQPAFGGTKTDCDDGLDNDLDGNVDHPADAQCGAANGTTEGVASLDGGLSPDGGASSDGVGSSGATGGPNGSSPEGPKSGAPPAASTNPTEDGCTIGHSSTVPLSSIGIVILLGVLRARRAKHSGMRTGA